MAVLLGQQFPKDLTPAEMTNKLLRPIVNAVLHSETLDTALNILETVYSK